MTIVNRLGEEFEYTLKGNEYYIPQLSNELDYFDYKEGTKPLSNSANSPSTLKGSYVVPRTNDVSVKKVNAGDLLLNAGVVYDRVETSVITRLCDEVDMYGLYGDSKTGDKARTPPLRKDLFQEKENNEDC